MVMMMMIITPKTYHNTLHVGSVNTEENYEKYIKQLNIFFEEFLSITPRSGLSGVCTQNFSQIHFEIVLRELSSEYRKSKGKTISSIHLKRTPGGIVKRLNVNI